MNIRITRLSMTNFKCFREKELDFDQDIVTIRGRNGEGKTTIADAILFCLFGKNVAGQSDLELFKTRENGQVIPNIDHSVEMDLLLETEIVKVVTLKRSINEVWVKKRGSEELVFKNNTVDYFVNGESYTKADYEKYINSLVSEQVFKAITNPNYFPSLKWQEQRQFLTSMVGSVEPESFADTDELKALVDYFDHNDEDIEAYLKHRSYQIKEIKKKLDKIPVRLEEQNKALPEKLDWDNIQTSLNNKQAILKSTESDILNIKQGNGSDVKRQELRNQITKTTVAIDKLRFEAVNESNRLQSEQREKINQYSLKFTEELNNQKMMDQTIQADNRLIERCEESIKNFAAELERLRIAWPNRKFEVDTNLQVCPTCGQNIPYEQYLEKVEQMRENFNKALEAEKQSLRDKAAKVKQDMADAEKELKDKKDKVGIDTKTLDIIKENINTIFAEKAKLEKEHIPTADELLSENGNYVKLLSQLHELQEELDSVTDSEDNREKLAQLEADKARYEAEIANLQSQIATRQQYDKIIALIDGINEEQKELVKQLSRLEQEEDIARQYQFRQNQLIESRINEHFKLVQWRLFRTVNNGGDSFEEPFCECYVDGVGYHSGLNQAARLNAGLDIVNALCKFYNVSAPIVLDNSESTINILETVGQQIRLQVYDSDLTLI